MNKYDPMQCLSRKENDIGSDNVDLVSTNCIDAISMGDAREIFVLDLNFEIKSYIDMYCLQLGKNQQDSKRPSLFKCDGTYVQKFRINRYGKIESMNSRNYCLTHTTKEEDVALNQ